jgi:hypothetical protein
MSHPHNHLVAPLDDAILLRAVWRGVVALNTLIRAVRREFSRREFAAVVGAQHAQLVAALRLPLAAKDHNPHVAGEVINEQQEVASSSGCSRCHRATQVPVQELEPLLGSEARLLGKRSRLYFINTQTSQNCSTWSWLSMPRTIPLALSCFRASK